MRGNPSVLLQQMPAEATAAARSLCAINSCQLASQLPVLTPTGQLIATITNDFI